jgi:hypothetical protein
MSTDRVRPGLGSIVLTPAEYLKAFVDQITTSSHMLMAMNPNSIYAIGPASTFTAFVGQIEADILSKPAGEQERLLADLVARLRKKLRGRDIPREITSGMDIEQITANTTVRVLNDLEAILSQLILDRAR